MASSSSSTTSPSKPSYDVFLSFRGSDTRQNFTSHLYAALRRKHILTFIDENDLERGNEISTLLNTIHESKISVIIFSQEYASSQWCLDELVKILECTETTGHKAIPIFYKVNPSDVSDLTGNFGKSFKELTKQFCKTENRVKTGFSALKRKKVKKWCSALKKASNLSGWDSSNYRNEVELIENIVEDILHKLYPNTSNEFVGIDAHNKTILPHLSMGSGDVSFIGLWGMGVTGPGKCKLNNGGCCAESRNGHAFSACSDTGCPPGFKGDCVKTCDTGDDKCQCPPGIKDDCVKSCEDVDECREKKACQWPTC